jgi:hypothetical protein
MQGDGQDAAHFALRMLRPLLRGLLGGLACPLGSLAGLHRARQLLPRGVPLPD